MHDRVCGSGETGFGPLRSCLPPPLGGGGRHTLNLSAGFSRASKPLQVKHQQARLKPAPKIRSIPKPPAKAGGKQRRKSAEADLLAGADPVVHPERRL